jgi:putative heme-binding domain-containing protein
MKNDSVVGLFELLLRLEQDQPTELKTQFAQLSRMIADGEISPDHRKQLASRLGPMLVELRIGKHALSFETLLLSTAVESPGARAELLKQCREEVLEKPDRLRGIEMLILKREPAAIPLACDIVNDPKAALDLRSAVLMALRRSDDEGIAQTVLAAYSNFPPELQTKAIDLLVERPAWSKSLLEAIGRRHLPPTVLNATHVTGLLARRDDDLKKLIEEHWGNVRGERNPEREKIVKDMRRLVRSKKGDVRAGAAAFKKTCAQCHQIFGHGAEVGPDLTSNGRNDFEQLLSNVFDPSLVIGRAYQAVTVVTTDGRTLSGLLVEDGQDRIVLRLQGGKQEIISRTEIDDFQRSKLSLMPEGLEKQLKPEEIIDLFAFLALEKPPKEWPNVESSTAGESNE